MQKEIRIAVIGTGFIGKQHIEAIRRIPYLKVAAVVDSNEEMAKQISQQLGIEQWYTDYQEVLKLKEIDVIDNCTPSFMHYPINKQAILMGKHVYCEKPLALNTQESAELVQLAKSCNLATGVNFNYRHNAMVQQMHRMIQKDETGRVLMVTGQYLQDWLLYETDYDWRMDPKKGGKSRAIADIGSHCFDLAQFVVGKKIIAVYASLFTSFPVRKRLNINNQYDDISISSEDGGLIMGIFEDGTPISITVSQVSAGKKNALSLNVNGSKTSLEWNQEKPDVLWIGHRDKANEILIADPKFLDEEIRSYANLPAGHTVGWHDAFTNGMKAFYQSIFEENFNMQEQLYATFENGHEIMKLVDACLESSQKHQWIAI